MKLSTVIAGVALAAGTALVPTAASAVTGAAVYEYYDYYSFDAAQFSVTNTNSFGYDDVIFSGGYAGQTTDLGPLAAGATSGGFYLGDNEADFPGSQGTATLTIVIGSHTYTKDFTDILGDPDFTIGATYVDTLAIGNVPEPATWSLMIAGFGAVGYTMRAARRKTVAA